MLSLSSLSDAKLTYDDMISSPRRSEAIPNPSGTAAVYSASAYSFDSHSSSSALYQIDIKTGSVTTVLDDASGTRYTSNGIRVVVTGWATPDGSLLSPNAPQRYDSGYFYDTLFVRHWDYWLTENRMSIFGLLLSKDLNTVVEPFKNYIYGLGIESPIMPFPSGSDFDLHDDRLIVNAKAPELNPANNTATYFYIVKYDGENNAVKPLNKAGFGACASPRFSPDGKRVAGLVMLENGYESDQNLLYLYDLSNDGMSAISITRSTDPLKFDRSPGEVEWSPDEPNVIYLMGEDLGREVVWKLNVKNRKQPPIKLSTTHSVASIAFLGGNSERILLTKSSLTSSTYYEVYSTPTDSESILLSGEIELDKFSVEEFWFKGSRGQPVHGFINYPTGFDPKKKYPLAFLIHGGPQSAWTDSWSTRWNPAVWADNGIDGYVVVTINPTGSTSYGKEFTDAIQNNWGSYPYMDLIFGLRYVLKQNGTFIDSERMIAAGASYGGYMVNWIQGMPFGRAFKALVTHDGVFSTLNQFSSDELYFPTHDFGGSFLTHTRGYYKFNPMNRMYNWATPHFIIHNAKDYRLPESEGLIAFNILQLRGIPSRLLHFPDENHWVLKPENSRRWHREVFGFINQYANATVPSTEVNNAAINEIVSPTTQLVYDIAAELEGSVMVV
ncbi:Alpha/Beta hydrolase protein [Dipodascopsis uninucleata]